VTRSSLGVAFGVGRALVGAALLAVPERVTNTWVGVGDAPAQVLARCLGGRDLVIGAGTAATAAGRGDPTPWLLGGVLADAIDGAATVCAGERIPRNGRLGTTALAVSSAVFGIWLACGVE
jgi:hypothetical protein